MSIESLSDENIDYFAVANWALETGIWDGRVVTHENAAECRLVAERRIAELLLNDPSDIFAAQLAWLGSTSENRPLLARDIQELRIAANGVVVMQAGLSKKISKFWKEHKTAILIGVGVAVVLAVAVAIVVCSGGTAASGVATLGAATCGALADSASGDKPSPNPTPSNTTGSSSPTTAIPTPPTTNTLSTPTIGSIAVEPLPSFTQGESSPLLSDPINHHGPVLSYDGLISNQQQSTPTSYAPSLEGILQPLSATSGTTVISAPSLPQLDPTYPPLKPIEPQDYFGVNPSGLTDHELSHPMAWLQELAAAQSPPRDTTAVTPPPSSVQANSPTSNISAAPPKKNCIQDALELIGHGLIDPELMDPTPIPDCLISRPFTLSGEKIGNLHVTTVNGMNTSFERAVKQAEYLQKFTPNLSIDLVYNCTHGPAADLAEIFCLNYPGRSPNVEEELIKNWSTFHFENLTAPNAKIFHTCYSQGALATHNSLQKCPQEIRDRVIVVALAPAIAIPDRLCYDSYNYATKNDVVPLGELVFAIMKAAVTPFQRMETLDKAAINHANLTVLEPHPDATGARQEHDFLNPAFAKPLQDHINDYLQHNGEYP